MSGRLREAVRRGRVLGAGWVRLLDAVRGLASSDGRAQLWTRIAHGGTLHQVSGHTEPDRYPGLFDLVARLQPEAARILSFGCSTGEEIEAIRKRFPAAGIVGAEINPKSRSAARRRMRDDARVQVVGPDAIHGEFDLIFALAVLQVQPHRVVDAGIDDLSAIYPFERFDRQVNELAGRLRPGGMLCLYNAQYRAEDSSAAAMLEAVEESPPVDDLVFAPAGKRYPRGTIGRSLFRKLR